MRYTDIVQFRKTAGWDLPAGSDVYQRYLNPNNLPTTTASPYAEGFWEGAGDGLRTTARSALNGLSESTGTMSSIVSGGLQSAISTATLPAESIAKLFKARKTAQILHNLRNVANTTISHGMRNAQQNIDDILTLAADHSMFKPRHMNEDSDSLTASWLGGRIVGWLPLAAAGKTMQYSNPVRTLITKKTTIPAVSVAGLGIANRWYNGNSFGAPAVRQGVRSVAQKAQDLSGYSFIRKHMKNTSDWLKSTADRLQPMDNEYEYNNPDKSYDPYNTRSYKSVQYTQKLNNMIQNKFAPITEQPKYYPTGGSGTSGTW